MTKVADSRNDGVMQWREIAALAMTIKFTRLPRICFTNPRNDDFAPYSVALAMSYSSLLIVRFA